MTNQVTSPFLEQASKGREFTSGREIERVIEGAPGADPSQAGIRRASHGELLCTKKKAAVGRVVVLCWLECPCLPFFCVPGSHTPFFQWPSISRASPWLRLP